MLLPNIGAHHIAVVGSNCAQRIRIAEVSQSLDSSYLGLTDLGAATAEPAIFC
jgi:hypothetical protein